MRKRGFGASAAHVVGEVSRSYQRDLFAHSTETSLADRLKRLASEEEEDAVLACASLILQARIRDQRRLVPTCQDAAALIHVEIASEPREVFVVLYMAANKRLIALERMFMGGLTGCEIHIGEIAKRCLRHNCDSIFIGHNHPSQSLTPSSADKAVTERIRTALKLIDVELVAHYVVAPTGWALV